MPSHIHTLSGTCERHFSVFIDTFFGGSGRGWVRVELGESIFNSLCSSQLFTTSMNWWILLHSVCVCVCVRACVCVCFSRLITQKSCSVKTMLHQGVSHEVYHNVVMLVTVRKLWRTMVVVDLYRSALSNDVPQHKSGLLNFCLLPFTVVMNYHQ